MYKKASKASSANIYTGKGFQFSNEVYELTLYTNNISLVGSESSWQDSCHLSQSIGNCNKKTEYILELSENTKFLNKIRRSNFFSKS